MNKIIFRKSKAAKLFEEQSDSLFYFHIPSELHHT